MNLFKRVYFRQEAHTEPMTSCQATRLQNGLRNHSLEVSSPVTLVENAGIRTLVVVFYVFKMEDVLRELVRISTEQQTLQREMIQEQRKQNALLHVEVQKCLTAASPIQRGATVQPNPG
ncbi:hypothetical protein NQZ68_002578 [Dissostichus eleginoides]|nr:hypothetical protein NQZ68_002578 [Dissostichus eleginoides]